MADFVEVVQFTAQASSALLTPLLGGLIAYDYVRRLDLSGRHLEERLYKRRRHISSQTMRILAEMIHCRMGQAPESAEELPVLASEGSFFFSEEIVTALDEIAEKSFEFVDLNHELAAAGSLGAPELDANRAREICEGIRECRACIRDQHRQLKKLFHVEMRKYHGKMVE